MKKSSGIARDIIALGSIPFYLIVIIRAVIGRFSPFVNQLVIALVILILLSLIIKQADQHIARGFILFAFISSYYESTTFTIFSLILWSCMIYSSKILKRNSKKIFRGIVLGIVTTAISYAITMNYNPITIPELLI